MSGHCFAIPLPPQYIGVHYYYAKLLVYKSSHQHNQFTDVIWYFVLVGAGGHAVASEWRM